MTRVKWFMSDLHACGYVRAEALAREVNQQYPNVAVDCKTECLLSDMYKTNVAVWQRSHSSQMLRWMQIARGQGVRVIYDIDDDMFNMPPEFKEPYDFYLRPDVREGLRACMQAADIVTVTTSELAESLAKVIPGKQWWVVENYLDVDKWQAAYARRVTGSYGRKEVTIGWMASGSHQIDAPLVADALRRVMEAFDFVRLHFIGWIGFAQIGEWAQKYKDRIRVEPWVDVSVLPEVMADFDIGIAPLVDNQFNRCKSSIKALQYWALGVPIVASPLPCYKGAVTDGADGWLCTTPDEWTTALSTLCDDATRRAGMGANGRAKLLAKHDMAQNCVHWVRLFERLVAGK